MGLVKNVLLAPYRGGVKVGNALKVKPDEDSFGKKVLKRGVLNVAVPVVAVIIASVAVQAIGIMAPLAPVLLSPGAPASVNALIFPSSLWKVAVPLMSSPAGHYIPVSYLVAGMAAGVAGAGIAVSGLAGLAKNAMKENIKFLKPAIESVFNVGARIGKSLEVKPEDSKRTRIAKMGILNVAAPVAAVALACSAAQSLLVMAAALPLLPVVGIPLLTGLAASATGVVGAGIIAIALAGVSKNAVEGKINFLKASFVKLNKESQPLAESTSPDSTSDVPINCRIDGDANKSVVRELGEVRELLPPADKISKFFQQGHSTESLLPPTATATVTSSSQESIPLQGKISGNGGLKL